MDNKIIKKIEDAPKTPGVYIFYKNQIPLYIGKASNLKNRLQAYLKINDVKTQQLHEEASSLKLIKLSSPIEALIEEAKLIKELKPQLNIYWRDDKNYFYVAFTKEEFPKVFITHQIKKLEIDSIGPFTDGKAIKYVLKKLRCHFSYCTCFKPHLRHCLNSQMGLCLGSCCLSNFNNCDRSYYSKYQKNIKTIKDILSGGKTSILRKIFRPEDSWAIENILEHSSFLNQRPRIMNCAEDARLPEGSSRRRQKHGVAAGDFWRRECRRSSAVLTAGAGAVRRWAQEPPFPEGNWASDIKDIKKIECYDISNFAGKEAVGAFTVLVDKNNQWLTDQSQFRRFKIKFTKNTRNDPAMIAEILKRRLNHPEWPYPDLIIIDGGVTQFNAAQKILNSFLKTKNHKLKTRLVSFAKPSKRIWGRSPVSQEVIERAVSQTHQYVISYHRKIRDKIEL